MEITQELNGHKKYTFLTKEMTLKGNDMEHKFGSQERHGE